LAREKVCVPSFRFPDPVQLAAVWLILLILVGPTTNPVPPPVQLKLLMGIVSVPETKAPPEPPEDLTSKVTKDAAPVFAFAVTLIAPSFAGIDGTRSGSGSSGKVSVAAPRVNFAELLTVAVTFKLLLSEAAKALPAIKIKPRAKTVSKLSFFISSLFSFLGVPQTRDSICI
jgi:hypothetical protein